MCSDNNDCDRRTANGILFPYIIKLLLGANIKLCLSSPVYTGMFKILSLVILLLRVHTVAM